MARSGGEPTHSSQHLLQLPQYHSGELLMVRARLPLPTIEDDPGQPFSPPDIPPLGVQVWADENGEVLGQCYLVNGQHWVHLPNLATYAYVAGADIVRVIAQSSARPEIVLDTYWRSVLPILLQAQGQEVLHASAIMTSKGVVAFCAMTETGKSTLAYALSRRGYSLWADDAVAFDTVAGQARAIPLPFRIHLRPASASLFGHDAGLPLTAPSWEIPGGIRTESAPLHRLFVLERSESTGEGNGVEIVRVTSSQALLAVLPHAYCFSLQDRANKQRMLQNYAELVNRVPVYALRFRPGFERLPMIMDQIEQVIGDFASRNSGC
jgi:hypothetical protein